MANDNTLGAPTEGLGQTVTFADGGRTGVPQAQAKQRQQLRLNAPGGGAALTARALQVPPAQMDPTFSVIAKLGGELLKPHLEAERTAAYVSGMQKAAEGQAITDIVNEQPWYSQLFGPTSLVDGARAYTASSKAANMAGEIAAKMPELRKLTGEEFAKYSADMLTKNATGDAVTDMMFQQQASRTLPDVMVSQAKQHLIYKQELYIDSQVSNIADQRGLLANKDAALRSAVLATWGDEASDPVIAHREYAAQEQRFVQSIQRPADMDKSTHDKLLGQELQRSLMDKDFSMFNAMKSRGLLNQLDPEVATSVQRAFDYAHSKSRISIPENLSTELADLTDSKAWVGKSEEELLAAMRDFNTKYTATTGDPTAFFGPAQTVQEVHQHRAQQQLALDKAAAELAKATKQYDKQAAAENLITNAARVLGDLSGNGNLDSIERPMKELAWQALQGTAPQNIAKAMVIQANKGEMYQGWKDSLNTAVASAITAEGASSTNLYAAYARFYKPLVAAGGDYGNAVAQSYANSTNGPILDRFDKFISGLAGAPGQADIDQAYQYALAKPTMVASGPIAKVVKSHVEDYWTAPLASAVNFVTAGDWVPLKDPQALTDELVPLMRPVDAKDKTAIKQEVDRLRLDTTTNIEVTGGYVIKRLLGSTGIKDWVREHGKTYGLTTDHYNIPFDAGVNNILATRGLTEPKIIQLGDVGGVPQFLITGKTAAGSEAIHYASMTDLIKPVPKINKASLGAPVAMPLVSTGAAILNVLTNR